MPVVREADLPGLPRVVSREALDHLDPDDPEARRARRDLHRINRILRSGHILATLLHPAPRRPRRILELGAGDGRLMLELARRMARYWPGVQVTLLDRHAIVDARTQAGIEHMGWQVRTWRADALAWAQTAEGGHAAARAAAGETSAGARSPVGTLEARSPHWDLILANLFVHHFTAEDIRQLFAAIAARADSFIACEPRRHKPALWGSRLLALVGATALTRRDAVASVHAGFRGLELTQLWPGPPERWQVQELPVGPFSHCFLARRKS